ncbi:MAG: sulfatase-like hydrolase/transferase [Terriglobia bacterium]
MVFPRSLSILCWAFLLFFASALRAADANVIIITIDTLRADHLACYGYSRVQTPNIDELARSAARFTRANTPVPITLPAHSALFTGSYPMANGMHDFAGNTLSPSFVTLAEVLRRRGYATGAFIGAAVLDSRFGLNQGFDTYFDHFDFSRQDQASLDRMERPGNQVMDEALRWLKANPRQPFALWVHLYDPHYPYTPPDPFASRYKAHPYDGEIAFADAQVGRLMSYMRQANLLHNAIVVLAGDHGEGLGEHGEETHGFFLYNSTLRVPLLIKIPNGLARVVDTEASLVDVMPTVLQALRLPIPATVQGRSLLSEILGRARPAGPPLYAENYLPLLHFRWSQLRSIEQRGLKFIDAPNPELYDLRSDPHELKNLIATRAAAAHELRGALFDVLRRYTPASSQGAQPALTDPALMERLRSLGYVAVSAGTFNDANGKALPDPKDRIQAYELYAAANEDSNLGRYRESLLKLQQAEKTEPASLAIRYLTGMNYYRLKEYPRAISAFRSALQLDPKFTLATYYLGVCQLETGELEDALASFRTTLTSDPRSFSAAYNLGVIYTRQRRADDAIKAFLRAIEILPEFAEAHEALGELYLYQQRVDDAVRELEKAAALNPDSRRAHRALGRAYAAKGMDDRAKEELERGKNPQ